MPILIKTIPAFFDNYIWLFHQANSRNAFVVDPGDAVPVLTALNQLSLNLDTIVVTHQHPDHIGGIPELIRQYPDVTIVGPKDISIVNRPVNDHDTFAMADTQFTTLAVPGHTLNHLAFFAQPENDKPILFCGDTLFSGGCGRLFEGSAAQMLNSLNRLSALPNNTRVFCAHEYTQANLAFANVIEPSNLKLQERIKEVAFLRQNNLATIPSSIACEKQTNPFLRASELAIKNKMEHQLNHKLQSTEEVFAAIRQWKDNF